MSHAATFTHSRFGLTRTPQPGRRHPVRRMFAATFTPRRRNTTSALSRSELSQLPESVQIELLPAGVADFADAQESNGRSRAYYLSLYA